MVRCASTGAEPSSFSYLGWLSRAFSTGCPQPIPRQSRGLHRTSAHCRFYRFAPFLQLFTGLWGCVDVWRSLVLEPACLRGGAADWFSPHYPPVVHRRLLLVSGPADDGTRELEDVVKALRIKVNTKGRARSRRSTSERRTIEIQWSSTGYAQSCPQPREAGCGLPGTTLRSAAQRIDGGYIHGLWIDGPESTAGGARSLLPTGRAEGREG